MNPSARQRLAQGLEKAIEDEAYGHNFYLMAARSTEDARGREVFEQLAAEELDHQRYLARQRRAILESGELDPGARLGTRSSLQGSSPIFSEELRARIREAHFEMTALAVGIQLEQNAIAFYTKEAEAVTPLDAGAGAFYRELAEWEAGHHQALLRQQEALRADFWGADGFSPF
jgi:rubrerythrin